ncbi:pre-mRNA-splicing factor 38-like [Dreissena polymorpha]|uniref:pre-mRNA-splicing factor 38-like n=1 Tax=Dreissena polymorpha TaxID=45954 RepID=UPI002263CC47|nr:pre-mRNA-splicing factor 38-like [Dreissena polymorpha]
METLRISGTTLIRDAVKPKIRAVLGAIKSHGLTVRGSRIVPRGSSERADSPRDRASGDGNHHSGLRNRDRASGDGNHHSGLRNRDNRYDSRQPGSRDGSQRRDQGGDIDRRDSRYDDRDDSFRTVHHGRNRGRGAGRGAGGRGRNGRYNDNGRNHNY